MINENTKYAVFDFGGVLFETSRTALYREIFARKGRSGEELDYFLNTVFPREVASKANLGTMAAVTAARAEEYPEWTDEIQAFNADREFIGQVRGTVPGMPEILKAIAGKGYGIFGLTNWAADTYQTLPTAYPEILGLFDKVVVSGAAGIKKPDPEIFRLAAQEFGNPAPSQVYYFDDKSGNISAAQEAVGWNGVLFDRKKDGPRLVAETFGL